MAFSDDQFDALMEALGRQEALLQAIAEGVGGGASGARGGGAGGAGSGSGGGRTSGGQLGGAFGAAVDFTAGAIGANEGTAALARLAEINLKQLPVLEQLNAAFDGLTAKLTALEKVGDIAAQAERLGAPLSDQQIRRLGAVEERGQLAEQRGRDRAEAILGSPAGGLPSLAEIGETLKVAHADLVDKLAATLDKYLNGDSQGAHSARAAR